MPEYDEQALRGDANNSWQPWSLRLQGWVQEIDALELDLPTFSIVSGADRLHAAVTSQLSSIRDYVHDGEEVFEGIARALLDNAIEYMEMEDYSQEEIRRVETEMDSL
ncbi:hypothetical protein FIV50_04645 [Microbacterium foliorum]|uniref:Uncharacterized protein n=1 Tax=Microbacterium foliorum TaxID=104336 RepID=A0A4Y5YMU3_9MICO|nr:hypothetical protein [Microbacterium foliorum]QDE34142.1 hypothetical protein FIV50_04645 [Microbacterium foliorum]